MLFLIYLGFGIATYKLNELDEAKNICSLIKLFSYTAGNDLMLLWFEGCIELANDNYNLAQQKLVLSLKKAEDNFEHLIEDIAEIFLTYAELQQRQGNVKEAYEIITALVRNERIPKYLSKEVEQQAIVLQAKIPDFRSNREPQKDLFEIYKIIIGGH